MDTGIHTKSSSLRVLEAAELTRTAMLAAGADVSEITAFIGLVRDERVANGWAESNLWSD
jgi:hypothetical protein